MRYQSGNWRGPSETKGRRVKLERKPTLTSFQRTQKHQSRPTSQMGHSQQKRDVRTTSAFPLIVTTSRTRRHVSNAPIASAVLTDKLQDFQSWPASIIEIA